MAIFNLYRLTQSLKYCRGIFWGGNNGEGDLSARLGYTFCRRGRLGARRVANTEVAGDITVESLANKSNYLGWSTVTHPRA